MGWILIQIMNISAYTVTAYVVASTGYYSGVGRGNSIRVARNNATAAAWHALYEGDTAAGYCSGIAVEGWIAEQYGRVLFEKCDI